MVSLKNIIFTPAPDPPDSPDPPAPTETSHDDVKENEHDEEVGEVEEDDDQDKLRSDSISVSSLHYRERTREEEETEDNSLQSSILSTVSIDPPEDNIGQQPKTPSMTTRVPQKQMMSSIKEEDGRTSKTSSSVHETLHNLVPRLEGKRNDNITDHRPPYIATSSPFKNKNEDDKEEDKEEDIKVKDNRDEQTISLPDDTYSLLLVSRGYATLSFWYGTVVFLQQLLLLCAILAKQIGGERQQSTTLNVPFANSGSVQLGQFTAIIFALFTQRDLLQSIPISIALLREENWTHIRQFLDNRSEETEGLIRSQYGHDSNAFCNSGCPTKYFFWERVFLVLMARLLISLLTLFSAFVIIIQSTDIIDLVKDFTALYIIAELDNYAYRVVVDGYFGNKCDEELQSVKAIKIKRSYSEVVIFDKRIPGQSASILVLFIVMMGTWIYYVSQQNSGAIFLDVYPDCDAFENDSSLSYTEFGDGTCDPRLFTEACGLDGGDCRDQCNTFFQFQVLPTNKDYWSSGFWQGIYDYYGCVPHPDKEGWVVCQDVDGYEKCRKGVKDASNYYQMSNCLPDEILYNATAKYNQLYWCWFASNALFDPNKNLPENRMRAIGSSGNYTSR